jgi:hypothetical protein
LIGDNSKLLDRNEKLTGWTYIHTNTTTGFKYQIIRSAGKHTNSMTSFLDWMLENAKQFVDKRLFALDASKKLKFFAAVHDMALSPDNTLSLLQFSQYAKLGMRMCDILMMSDDTKIILADLILIGVDNNQQHIRAVASNYREKRCAPSSNITAAQSSNEDNQQPTTDSDQPSISAAST